MTPPAMRLEQALRDSAPLARLRALMRDSQARLATIGPLLPGTLAPHVRPGPVDDLGWSLLAANASVAAKLRQLQPRLEDALRDAGWEASAIRIKIVQADP